MFMTVSYLTRELKKAYASTTVARIVFFSSAAFLALMYPTRVDEIANLRAPTIMLGYPPKGAIVRKASKSIGHYLVLLPLGNNTVQVIDYPQSPVILDTQTWIKHLNSIGIEDIPILLCGTKKKKLSDMLSHQREYSQFDAIYENKGLRKNIEPIRSRFAFSAASV